MCASGLWPFGQESECELYAISIEISSLQKREFHEGEGGVSGHS